jgi:single-strand DNA-binding protein
MGRLTRDPELRRTGSGLAVASFSVAVERDYPNKDTGEKEVDFINCVAWRQTGEFVSKYFTKGSMIIVSGRLQIRNWTDDSGNKRTTAEIVAENVYFGGSKKESSANNTTSENTNPYSSWPDFNDVVLPF